MKKPKTSPAPATVTFRGVVCTVQPDRYADGGRIALRLLCPDGDLMAVATVNLPEAPLPAGHVFIKNWSENAGILEALIAAQILDPPCGTVPTGYVEAYCCKLSDRLRLTLTDLLK